MNKVIIYCDGGARNNPGPAAIGVVIKTQNLKLKTQDYQYSEFIGQATNNEAEYRAVISALKKVKQLVGKEKSKNSKIEIKSDSELLINQLNGQYKIKEKNLVPLFIEIWNLKQDFADTEFVQVPREENKQADLLVNRELNNRVSLFR